MTYRIFPALLLSLVLFGGCAAQNHPSAAPESGGAALAAAPESFPAPIPPQGMRLGTGYTSALNEPCYELVPLNTPFESARALCLRGGQWTEVPPMLMDVPPQASFR